MMMMMLLLRLTSRKPLWLYLQPVVVVISECALLAYLLKVKA